MPSETLLLLILINCTAMHDVFFPPQEVDFHSKVLAGLVYCQISHCLPEIPKDKC